MGRAVWLFTAPILLAATSIGCGDSDSAQPAPNAYELGVILTYNSCPEFLQVMVVPLDAELGEPVKLSVGAQDSESHVSFLWTADAGESEDPSAATTLYFCTSNGMHQLTVTVTDEDGCSKPIVIPIRCHE